MEIQKEIWVFIKPFCILYNNDFYSALDEFDKLENQLDDWGLNKAGLLSSKGQNDDLINFSL